MTKGSMCKEGIRMEKTTFSHIIDFNIEINRLKTSNKPGLENDVIELLAEFKKKITPFSHSSPKDYAYITSSAKMTLMSTVCSLGTASTSISPSAQVKILEAGFTGDGVFSGVPFPAWRPVRDEPKFLAACYHLVMNHPGNTNESANSYLLALSMMGFEGGEPFGEFKSCLVEIEAHNPGTSRVEVADYLVRELPLNSRFSNETAAFLQDNGGLNRCLELNMKLDELMGRMIENLEDSSAPLSDLAKIHTLCNSINSHLYTNLAISRSGYQRNAEALLTLALDLKKGGGRILEASESLPNISLTANQVIKIASFSSKSDDIMKRWVSGGTFEEGDIRAAIEQLDAGVQHQVIDRLDLQGLFSSREMNVITGRRLERELGL